MTYRFIPAVVASVAMIGSLLLAPAYAEKKVTLKYANILAQSTKEAGIFLKEIVERESGGTIIINVFQDNVLGDDRVVTETTIFGDIDIAISSTSPIATIFPDLYLFDAPFLFLSSQEAYNGLDGFVGQKILKDMEKKGLKGLAFFENGFRNFTNNKVVVKLPKDAKNMKIRTMENEIHIAAWKALGINPTPMAFAELFPALQQGTVDGQENPLGIIDGNRIQEVQKQLSLTQHVYTPYVIFMNLDKYNSLSDKQRAVIDKAIEETTKFQRERSAALEKEILEKVQKEGVTVTELSAEDKGVWQKIITDAKIYDTVKAKMAHPEYFDEIIKK